MANKPSHQELEQNLVNERYYLEQAQEIGQMGTFEHDIIEDVIRWTPELYRLWGLETGTELTLELLTSIMHPDDREIALQAISVAYSTGKEYDIEIRIIVDGEIRWNRNKAKLIFDDAGRVVRAIGISQDITDRKEMEQTLNKERYYLEQSQKIGKIGTWEHNIEDDIVTWTPEVYRLWGLEHGTELSNELTLSLIHPDDRDFATEKLNAAFNGEPYDMEFRIIVDGEVRWNRNIAKLINDDNDELIKMIGITQDVTYMKEAEETLKVAKQKDEDNRYLHRELRKLTGDKIIGDSFGLREVMEKAHIASRVDSPVLLQGETGVGKDVIANAIHYASERKDGPFIKVNCGAIPESLIDSELFGYEKGAFTGALKTRKGKFERSDKGTIFLDEIGELPPQAQTRLLRVVQDKVIERVGGESSITLDIRIIAATNRNLEEMVESGDFREDLWYRLNVFPMDIPPLRDRVIDIPALVEFFVQKKAKELKLNKVPSVQSGAVDILTDYHWPGNVRELQNIIEREIIINPEGPIDFGSSRIGMARITSESDTDNTISDATLDGMIVSHIRSALKKCDGKIHGPDGAAERLGMNPNTLRSKIRKLSSQYKF